jgi:hypothetical protein
MEALSRMFLEKLQKFAITANSGINVGDNLKYG